MFNYQDRPHLTDEEKKALELFDRNIVDRVHVLEAFKVPNVQQLLKRMLPPGKQDKQPPPAPAKKKK